LQENFESKKSLALTYGLASNAERKSLKEEIILADAREKELRSNARKIIDKIELKVESNDKDYVFIHFILNHLPRGVIGLLLAMALSAAMSSTASELNALSTTTTMDLYKRGRGGKSDRHYLMASKWFTLLWGVLAILFASIASLFDNLIQLVNIIGSIFYGNILGVFLLAFFFRFVRSNAVFIAAIITQAVVIFGYQMDWMPYLWLNLFGAALVVTLACLLQVFLPRKYGIVK